MTLESNVKLKDSYNRFMVRIFFQSMGSSEAKLLLMVGKLL